jgi:hypothetical protein
MVSKPVRALDTFLICRTDVLTLGVAENSVKQIVFLAEIKMLWPNLSSSEDKFCCAAMRFRENLLVLALALVLRSVVNSHTMLN